ncbi:NAD(P)-dependent oxidoreductase [Spirosoma sp. KCTC 42546]|uniref:NAD-dependent epimerase/dehydratase family protein n=1 Tax=Spirosoma sp. KCTC 42546 TaxID=2520506 RepID=UPI001156DAB6|nr:NAD(P)-dependent oxidoreductase [Spirosoma sp. KCTC 42546]QDK83094.1 NAD(P)-dependent oxidoreductase [Spirosoma sp. KCTC 42546]
MTKIALTGATGFIGSAVLKQLVSDGHEAVVLLRNESNQERIKGVAKYQTIYYQNLDQNELKETLAAYNPDAFIHIAWKGVGGNDRNEPFQITQNLPFTLHSVELAHAVGCRHWVGIGSQAEYGNPNHKVAETAPTLPTTLYGKAKLASCWAALGLSESLNMKGSWIRVFSTYGIGDEPSWFIPYIISELKKGKTPKLTKCEQLWDYLYVDDAARAIVSVLYKEMPGIFNIGSGQAISLKSVVELIKQNINPDIKVDYGAVPYRSDQVMHLEADTSKIRQLTGWTPEVNIEEGLKRIIAVS